MIMWSQEDLYMAMILMIISSSLRKEKGEKKFVLLNVRDVLLNRRIACHPQGPIPLQEADVRCLLSPRNLPTHLSSGRYYNEFLFVFFKSFPHVWLS